MSDDVRPSVMRQWVASPGGACDARIGHGALGEGAAIFRTAVGKPRRALLVSREGDDGELVELTRRELSSAGFDVRAHVPGAGRRTRSLEGYESLARALAANGITSDDLVVVVGGTDLASLASAVAGVWCAGTPLAVVADDLSCAIECAVTPRGIDVGERRQALRGAPWCRILIVDFDHLDHDLAADATRSALALMVASAVADSEQSFSRLWDASLQMTGEQGAAVLEEQVADALKTRGRLMSSTAIVTRQSLRYGTELAEALRGMCDAAEGTLLAEGMRFSARLSAAQGELSVDDVLAQDELLERLGLLCLGQSLDAAALLERLIGGCLARSNRMQLALPRSLGRVRMSNVTRELLREHVEAFCASRLA
ncbi:dehydroquinate synthase/iron-containing alcohol dehydrogenase family protein [Olsenella massiliensis]|uniref:hypothetical protein n=1 Tax=Olsenella massiliensis TaxID=1622075 RepID=UPI00071DDF5D|nr:hypothetical protein [Olsenella massiliensis]